MPKETLRETVARLNETLNSDQSVAPEERDAAAQMSGRVEAILNGSADSWPDDLKDELERQLIAYEEKHPLLASVITQMLNTLNNIGI